MNQFVLIRMNKCCQIEILSSFIRITDKISQERREGGNLAAECEWWQGLRTFFVFSVPNFSTVLKLFNCLTTDGCWSQVE